MVTIYLISLLIAPQLWIEPFVGVRVDLFIYPLWFAYIFFTGRSTKFFELNKQDIIFMLFVIWLILSAIINDGNANTQAIIVNYIKWFVLYKMIAVTVDSNEAFVKTIHRLMLIVGVIVVEAIQHKLSSDGLGWAGQTLAWVDQSVLDAGGTGRTRWINIFDGPGVFCVMFTLVLPFILIRQDSAFTRKEKLVAYILLLPLLYAIWTTGSRGGFLATLAIFASYTLSRLNLSLTTMLRIGTFLTIVFMLAPSHLTTMRDSNRSAKHRVDMWIEGIEMVQQNPALGIGRGNFAHYTGTLIAHNSAIEIMGETGLPGLFFWMALIYMSIKTVMFRMATETDQRTKSYYRGLIICIVGYLANSMFVTLEYETLYFMLALTRSLDTNNDERLLFEGKDIMRVFYILAGFFITIKIFVQIY
jgi:hypothetical protein